RKAPRSPSRGPHRGHHPQGERKGSARSSREHPRPDEDPSRREYGSGAENCAGKTGSRNQRRACTANSSSAAGNLQRAVSVARNIGGRRVVCRRSKRTSKISSYLILLRLAAKAKLRLRSFSSSFSFSANVSNASFLRVSLLIEIPLLELLFSHPLL